MKTYYEEIPLEVLTKPQEGYVCMLNRFWLIGKGGGALCYTEISNFPLPGRVRGKYPQCHDWESMAQRWVGKAHAGAVEYTKIPVAYWPPAKD